MVRDHETVNKLALDLVKKLKVTPEDNDASRSLSKSAASKLIEFGKLKGAEFDKAYVSNEVAYHKAVDDAFESQILARLRAPLSNFGRTARQSMCPSWCSRHRFCGPSTQFPRSKERNSP